MEETFLTKGSKIFATGVFLEPVECTINGKKQWRWLAVSFEEDSYFEGNLINPVEYSENIHKLATYFDVTT